MISLSQMTLGWLRPWGRPQTNDTSALLLFCYRLLSEMQLPQLTRYAHKLRSRPLSSSVHRIRFSLFLRSLRLLSSGSTPAPSVATGRSWVCTRFPSAFLGAALAAAWALATHAAPVLELLQAPPALLLLIPTGSVPRSQRGIRYWRQPRLSMCGIRS